VLSPETAEAMRMSMPIDQWHLMLRSSLSSDETRQHQGETPSTLPFIPDFVATDLVVDDNNERALPLKPRLKSTNGSRLFDLPATTSDGPNRNDEENEENSVSDSSVEPNLARADADFVIPSHLVLPGLGPVFSNDVGATGTAVLAGRPTVTYNDSGRSSVSACAPAVPPRLPLPTMWMSCEL